MSNRDMQKGMEFSGEFLERYHLNGSGTAGLAKYAELREIIAAAIDDGYWPPGGRLPNEAVLAKASRYSLGTVQKAMRDLVSRGAVIRRRGEGTFVAVHRTSMHAPLHLRFEDEYGEVLEIYPRITRRETVPVEGRLIICFGAHIGEMMRIDRLFSVGKIFNVFSSIYLDVDRYPVFASMPEEKLQVRNFKDVFFREHNVSIQGMQQIIKVMMMPDSVCERLSLPAKSICSKLEVTATGADGRVVYFQEAYIPPNSCRLRLPNWSPGS